MEIWPMIGAERAALAADLAALDPGDWQKPSLCAGWTVRDVVAHMLATAGMTPPKFFVKLAGCGFAFDRMVRKDIDRLIATHDDQHLLAGFRARADARNAPPGPVASWLGETIVHGEDVFRALGRYRSHSAEHLITVADFYKGSNMIIGAKRRIEGVSLRATDTQWQHGAGPEVAGPMIALVMAMTGRKAALEDLTGAGVAVLAGRP